MKQPRRWTSWLLDPVLIIGTGLSVGLGVVFYIFPDPDAALGAVAGLLGVVIVIQVQLVLMMLTRARTDTRTGRIVEAIEGSTWLSPVMDEILASTASIEREFGSTPAVMACNQVFQDCHDRLIDLQRGHFSVPYGEMQLINTLTNNAEKTLWATSVQEIDLAWWLTPKSQHYWKLQQDALARGVKVTRIFIYHDWNNDLAKLAAAQVQAGVEVMRMRRDDILPQSRTDMIIWDEACAYETRSNAVGEPVLNFFTVARQDLERASDQFRAIRTLAVQVAG